MLDPPIGHGEWRMLRIDGPETTQPPDHGAVEGLRAIPGGDQKASSGKFMIDLPPAMMLEKRQPVSGRSRSMKKRAVAILAA